MCVADKNRENSPKPLILKVHSHSRLSTLLSLKSS